MTALQIGLGPVAWFKQMNEWIMQSTGNALLRFHLGDCPITAIEWCFSYNQCVVCLHEFYTLNFQVTHCNWTTNKLIILWQLHCCVNKVLHSAKLTVVAIQLFCKVVCKFGFTYHSQIFGNSCHCYSFVTLSGQQGTTHTPLLLLFLIVYRTFIWDILSHTD